MSLYKTIEKVAMLGEEEFVMARDAKHAESMRVSAFNYRRHLPKDMIEDIDKNKHGWCH